MTIKAIETRYAGCRFRSRIEARWAVFFDTLGVEWRYEPQGYELPSGNYLPDFFLPHIKSGTWFEVKGAEVAWDDKCVNLAKELADMTAHRVIIAWGDIPRDLEDGDSESMMLLDQLGGDLHYMWCICRHCGAIGAEFDGRSARVGCGCSRNGHPDKDYNYDDPRLLRAYEAARSARFEHGESGYTA